MRALLLSNPASILLAAMAGLTLVVPPSISFSDAEEQVLQVLITEEPTLPASLRNRGVLNGYAEFLISLDAENQLEDALLVEASRLEFGTAVDQVIHEWKFIPPAFTKDLDTSPIYRLRVNFAGGTAVISALSVETYGWLSKGADSRNAFKHYSLDELDYLPKPINRVAPKIPEDLKGQAIQGEVTFSFYIDGGGNVRMPVLEEADPELDRLMMASAFLALEQWKFETPTVNGKPVLARATQVFKFDLESEVVSFED